MMRARFSTDLSVLDRPEASPNSTRAALLIAHPGHELRVFGWASAHRPRVYVLTDGSGATQTPRLDLTAALLEQLGAEKGETFGLLSDAEMYDAILARESSVFVSIATSLAGSLLRHGTKLLAADAAEQFNPAHDLCRMIADAAVLIAQKASDRRIENREFNLAEWTRDDVGGHDASCAHFELDDDMLRRKAEAAACYQPLGGDIAEALATKGAEYFRTECLCKVTEPFKCGESSAKPYYETWGERRVAEGTYSSVIRRNDHILPIADALRAQVEGAACLAPESTLNRY